MVTPKDTGSIGGNIVGVEKAAFNQSLTRKFIAAQQEQAREIAESIGSSLELQILVKQTIKEYNEALAMAKSPGQTVGDLVDAAVASKKCKHEDDGAEEAQDAEDNKDEWAKLKGTKLGRHPHVFGEWSVKLLNIALCLIDPQET